MLSAAIPLAGNDQHAVDASLGHCHMLLDRRDKRGPRRDAQGGTLGGRLQATPGQRSLRPVDMRRQGNARDQDAPLQDLPQAALGLLRVCLCLQAGLRPAWTPSTMWWVPA